MSFLQKLQNYNNAAYPALWIQTFEESRICKDIATSLPRKPSANDAGCVVFEWDCLNGLTETTTDGRQKAYKDTQDPLALFKKIQEICVGNPSENLFILKDAHNVFSAPLKGPSYIRAFKNILAPLRANRNTILFVSAVVKIPVEISKDIQLVDYALPGEPAILEKLTAIHNSANAGKKTKDQLVLPDDIKEAAVEAAKGMTATEVENAFALAIVENRAFNQSFVKSVFTEKTLQVKKGGLLTHLESDISFSNVGGLQGVKKWITARARGFSREAREYKLPFPKGLGLAGIPGCGKTLISKGIATALGVPLYQLDLGGLFGKYVGNC